MIVRPNEASKTVPKTSLVVPDNLGRTFLATEWVTSPLDTGKRGVALADVLVSSRTADADDENIVYWQDTCSSDRERDWA